jgi:histidyl-tRNA synthetase
VLDGLLETIGVLGPENAAKKLTVLRAMDKYDRLGIVGVSELLGSGRKDESGDFTKGAGLDRASIETVLSIFEPVKDSADKIAQIDIRLRDSKIGQEGREELEQISTLVKAAGYGPDRILIDPSVVRGLEYYTGPVYEVELTLETKDEKGRPVRFGSVGGGGRYDGLVSRFRGEPVPATGFSIGVSRLQAALAALGKLDTKAPAGPVLVTVFGADSVPAAQQLTAKLRGAGIGAELYLGNPKHGIGQQLKYADRRSSPCAVIQGPDEKAKGEVLIRDLIAGAAPVEAKERDEYLKKQAEAQVAVKETQLIDEVRKLLKRRGLA